MTDNRVIKYDEEIPNWNSMTDEQFLAAAQSWVDRSEECAEKGHSLVFVGRNGVKRLVEIAKKSR